MGSSRIAQKATALDDTQTGTSRFWHSCALGVMADPPLIDEMIFVHGISRHVMGIDEMGADVNHVFLVACLGSVGLGQNARTFHAAGGTNVDVPGPVIVVGPLVLTEAVA